MSDRATPASGSTGYGTWPFFVAALGITWSLQFPALLAQRGFISGPSERFMPLVGIGGFGPLLAAVLVSRFESGIAGVRALFRPTGAWCVGVGWYVVAPFLFGAIYLAGTAIYQLFGGEAPGRWLYPPENAQQVAAMVLFPIAEEPGWRGFALPRLQRRYGALKASLVVGLGWAMWHAVMFVLQGASCRQFALLTTNVLAGSVVFGWFYNRTRGSLLLAILLHLGAHLNNPAHVVPARVTPFAVYTVAIAVFAVAVVVADRRAWGQPAASAETGLG